VSDHRELEQDLVELALGEVAEPRRSELLSHLSDCLRCRAMYADIVGAIDATVPAAPEAQPPAGFDLRVLSALGIGTAPEPTPVRRIAALFSPRALLAAAAVVLVLLAGVWAGTAMFGESQPQTPVASGTAVLQTGEGDDIGTAAVAWMHEDRVLVVAVNNAPVGVPYTCRVRLAEGQTKDLGRWEASSPEGGTWVVPAPQGDINGIELVTDSGQVWSSARLP
jgi:anti-sigma factor RsiW